MTGLRRCGRLRLLLLLLLATPSLAFAEERAVEAEAEMVKARHAMDRQEFEAAVGHLLVARSLAPEASGPYLNLGLSYAALGRCDQAVPVLEEYLRRKTKDPQPSAAATLTACRAALAPPATAPPPPAPPPPPTGAESSPIAPYTPLPAPRPQLGHLVIRIEPVAADVVLNGRRVASNARLVDRELPAGGYSLEVSQRGYHSFTRDGWLPDGETAVERVTLQRRRIWPTLVGLGVGAAATGGIITIVAVAATPRSVSETPFSTETIP